MKCTMKLAMTALIFLSTLILTGMQISNKNEEIINIVLKETSELQFEVIDTQPVSEQWVDTGSYYVCNTCGTIMTTENEVHTHGMEHLNKNEVFGYHYEMNGYYQDVNASVN